MADLKLRFEKAAVDVLQLAQRPDDETLLKLYSLYKQSRVGDVFGKQPDASDVKGRSKYDAWAELKGMPPHKAMQAYIDLVEDLQG